MAEDSSQEKTELPTARRLEKAREDGDVARSKELSMAMIMIVTSALMIFMGGDIVMSLGHMMTDGLLLDRALIFDAQLLPVHLGTILFEGFWAIVPILLVTLFITLVTPAFMGGWIFSTKAFMPKASKLSPIKGFGRMFGVKAIVELLKAVGKFLLVAGIGLFTLTWYSDGLLGLGKGSPEAAFMQAGEIMAWSVFFMCLSLVLIAAIDVPFQAYQHTKKLKMTLQEVKDEMKDVEGRPEVKAAIRQKQREMSMQRMVDAVPDADVVIVNPEHFAVALSYDQASEGAPKVVAKGVDHMSDRIRDVAKENAIEIVRLPTLARAIYYTTELDQEVPEPLYLAVAQVLSYVFSLNNEMYGDSQAELPQIDVPDDYQFDINGNPAVA
jgi:flagellar biosynthetic protein FlhB